MSAILTKSNKVSNTVTSKEHISTTPVPNNDFLKTLKRVSRGHGNLLVASFPQPPSQGYWGSRILTRADETDLENGSDKNWYTVVSTFESNRRRKTEFNAMVAVMVDDPGTKVPFENIALPPTYWLETSPGNYQAWYFLAEPITDRAYAESIVNAMVAQGLSKDGKDPGMKGVTRYGRLPGGWNNKESLDKPHRVTAYKDTRGCNYYTAEQIIEAYELDLAAVAHLSNGDIQGDVDQLDVLTAQNDPIYKMFDSLGLIKYIQGHKIEITCPWVDDHTGGIDNGAALLILPGGGLGFKCHHGHDEHKTLDDVHRWLRDNHYELYDSYYPQKQKKELNENAEDTLESELQQLIDDGIDGSELTGRLNDLAKEYRERPERLEKQFSQMRAEVEAQEDAAEAITQLDDLEAIKNSALPIEQILWGDGGKLASQIKELADAMPTCSDFLLTTLFSVFGSRIGTSSTLNINPKAGYKVQSIFRTIIVATSGQMKSPVQKAIIASLMAVEENAHTDYQNRLATYDLALETWKPDNGPRPEKPTRKRYISTDDTLAKRVEIHKENPRGFLLYRDEGSAFITERGRFTNGRGDGGELEADLSEFDGTFISRDRKADGSLFIAKTAISRTGSTQYETLQKLMGDHSDACGEFARYLFCLAQAPPAYIDISDDSEDLGLTDNLVDLIEDLDELPEQEYRLSKSGIKAYTPYQHELIDREMETNHPSMRVAFPKFRTYFGRFILWLHIVNSVLAGQSPKPTIGASTVKKAQLITEYFIGHFRLLLAINSPQEELTGDLLKLRDYIAHKGPVSLRKIAQRKLFAKSTDKAKHKMPYLNSLLSTLEDKGYVTEFKGEYLPR